MFSLNKQPTEPITYMDDGRLDVVNVWPTIQGEGPYAGTPAVFVRLAGCNLQCPGCDTDYTSVRSMELADDVANLVAMHSTVKNQLVVLTGGEPFRQNIVPLVKLLLLADHVVQIETNGMLYLDDLPYIPLKIIVSPKTPKVHPNLLPWITAYKYVMRAGEVDDTDGLPTKALGGFRPARPHARDAKVFLNPMDEGDADKNRANVQAVCKSCMSYGYTMGLQMHKIIGVE